MNALETAVAQCRLVNVQIAEKEARLTEKLNALILVYDEERVSLTELRKKAAALRDLLDEAVRGACAEPPHNSELAGLDRSMTLMRR